MQPNRVDPSYAPARSLLRHRHHHALKHRKPQLVLHHGLCVCLRLSWPPARAQGSGDCSSWYMDYHQCLDQCAVKSLFKVTN